MLWTAFWLLACTPRGGPFLAAEAGPCGCIKCCCRGSLADSLMWAASWPLPCNPNHSSGSCNPNHSSGCCRGRALWVYWMLLSWFTTWPLPLSSHLVVSRPSTPTGPLAWILLVEMPTCTNQ